MVVLALIIDSEADDNGVQKSGVGELHGVLTEVIPHFKVQFVSPWRKCLPGQDRAVIATIIIGDAAAELVMLTLQSVERPDDPATGPAGGSIQYVCGQLSHRALLAGSRREDPVQC